MANPIKQLADKFNRLPPAGKLAVAGGAGLGLYLLFFKGREKQNTSTTDATLYYPYPDEYDFSALGVGQDNTIGGSGTGSYGDGSVSGGDIATPSAPTMDDYYAMQGNIDAWGTSIMESIGQSYSQQEAIMEGIRQSVQEKTLNTANYDLYAAQLAYKYATTDAERQAAAAAGEAARAEGATDAGANQIWAQNKGKISSSSGSSSSSSKSSSSSGSSKKSSSSNTASDGKIYSKGGSGKEFVYNPKNGNIGVTKNGKTTYVSPGSKNYNATKKAMEADTGRKF